MKYRVIKEWGLYAPQMRRFFIWTSTSEPATKYNTLEEAIADIESHKRIFAKNSKTEVVWWSW
jgi:hypothetical protein